MLSYKTKYLEVDVRGNAFYHAFMHTFSVVCLSMSVSLYVSLSIMTQGFFNTL